MIHTITALNGAGTSNPRAVSGYEASRETRTVIHDLLDGSLGVSFVPPRPRAGTLVLVYTDRAQAWAATQLHTQLTRFSYATDEVADVAMTYVPDGRIGITQDSDNPNVWIVSIDYQEV